jgi:hypothetical protein
VPTGDRRVNAGDDRAADYARRRLGYRAFGRRSTLATHANTDTRPVEPLRALGRTAMKSTAMMGVFLVLLGVAALVYQGITYTTRETVLDLGPIQATKETTKTMPLPPILGGMALLGGVVLIVIGAKRS